MELLSKRRKRVEECCASVAVAGPAHAYVKKKCSLQMIREVIAEVNARTMTGISSDRNSAWSMAAEIL